MLEVRSLVKQYPGTTAVYGVSIVAKSAEVTGYLGPNGFGK